MNELEPVDIAIIGGGMVGATLAALLAQANPNWRIALLEAFELPAAGEPIYQPSFDDRSTAIAWGSVTLLQQAGLWDILRQQATPIHQVHVSDRGHLGGSLIDRHQAGVEALGYVVPNTWIGRTLLSHLHQLPNLQLLAPAQVGRIQPVADGARLSLRYQGEEYSLHTDLVVIADGARSPLRESLGIDLAVEDYRQTAVIANISLDQPHQGVAYERFTDEGPLALLPLGGSVQGCQSALVWTQPSECVGELLQASDDDFLQRLQQRFGYRLGRLIEVGKRDSYPLALSVAKEQVRSSIVIMGNAAHFLHPVAGQGFNLALRDCAALAATLKQNIPGERLGSLSRLQQYQQQQQLDQQLTIQFSDQLTKWFSSSALPRAALRALGFIGLEAVAPAKGWLTQQTMGSAGRKVIL
ncbi:2-octaprenyl-6-methoxyphenyl hydroxylase [Pseudomaricurvus alkylphenolicus]|uniref:2-octaprenyl-6-methoxyphenyl hydroxylase n=1 Tax=Pseudomaricurvus alkylphenolicus TaxID=1306991 RepID=UPI0019808A37|nr:2-octaprenyl-6-methoxyphenyl hydroxylase [Pseudomaricurvus alkylphenolicus]